MGRILAIDYGRKRVGLATTDELQLIANALDTVHAKDIIDFLHHYISRENVEKIVIGEPRQMDYSKSESSGLIESFYKKLKKEFPEIEIELFDERFTSQMAFQAMIDSGIKKKDRQNKALVDKISATIILQSYLESIKYKKE